MPIDAPARRRAVSAPSGAGGPAGLTGVGAGAN